MDQQLMQVTNQLPNPLNAHLGIGAEEPIMPYLHQTRGQDMLKEATNELHGINRGLSPASAVHLAPAEGNVAVSVTDDTAVGYGHAEYVS